MPTYLRVNPCEPNGTYFRANRHRMALKIEPFLSPPRLPPVAHWAAQHALVLGARAFTTIQCSLTGCSHGARVEALFFIHLPILEVQPQPACGVNVGRVAFWRT